MFQAANLAADFHTVPELHVSQQAPLREAMVTCVDEISGRALMTEQEDHEP